MQGQRVRKFWRRVTLGDQSKVLRVQVGVLTIQWRRIKVGWGPSEATMTATACALVGNEWSVDSDRTSGEATREGRAERNSLIPKELKPAGSDDDGEMMMAPSAACDRLCVRGHRSSLAWIIDSCFSMGKTQDVGGRSWFVKRNEDEDVLSQVVLAVVVVVVLFVVIIISGRRPIARVWWI